MILLAPHPGRGRPNSTLSKGHSRLMFWAPDMQVIKMGCRPDRGPFWYSSSPRWPPGKFRPILPGVRLERLSYSTFGHVSPRASQTSPKETTWLSVVYLHRRLRQEESADASET